MRTTRPLLLLALVATLLANALPAGAAKGGNLKGWDGYDRKAKYEVVVETDLEITMRDGTILVADVHRPDAKGRFPVLLSQTPYGKGSAANDYFVERGYVHVAVDVRGTGDSEGVWESFGLAEQGDGYELVEWAARQPWSNGRVGTWGASYLAINQLLTAAHRPPHLKATFPIVPMADAYRDVSVSGGSYNVGFIPAWQIGLVGALSLLPPAYTASDPARAVSVTSSQAGNLGRYQIPSNIDALSDGRFAYDGPLYRLRSPIRVAHRIEVPTFITGGLHDLFQRGEPLLYEQLRAAGTTTKLLMGPWGHLAGSSGEGLTDMGFPMTLDQLALRWFDQYLKGMDTGADELPDVTQWKIGADRFERQPAWPHPKARALALNLRAGGALSDHPKVPNEPGDTRPVTPANGMCSRSLNQWTAMGAAEATPCASENRHNEADAFTYSTPPLAQDLEVSGPIGANLWVSTTARDVALTVRVTDVAPDGTSTEITSGWLMASKRRADATRARTLDGHVVQPFHLFTREAVLPVEADRPMLMQVEVWPTNVVFRKGHSIRLSITTSDVPHQLNARQAADSAGGTVTILHNHNRTSQLVLPVLGDRARFVE